MFVFSIGTGMYPLICFNSWTYSCGAGSTAQAREVKKKMSNHPQMALVSRG